MIKSLTSTSSLVYISHSSHWGPHINMGNPSAGMVRYNGNTNSLEVYDGSTWHQIGGDTSISIDHKLDTVVAWAHKKMAEEKEELELRNHPLVKDSYDTYQTTLELVKKHNIGEFS